MANIGPKNKRTGARKHWSGFGKKRVKTLNDVIVKNGGTVLESLDISDDGNGPQSTIIIVVSNNMKRCDFNEMFSAKIRSNDHFVFVTPEFITMSAQKRRSLSPSRFAPKCLTEETATASVTNSATDSKAELIPSTASQSVNVHEVPIFHDDDVAMKDINDDANGHSAASESRPRSRSKSKAQSITKWVDRNRDHFACQIEGDGLTVNRNPKISGILSEMSSFYDCLGDEWRSFTYKKISGFIAKCPSKIRSESDLKPLYKLKGFSPKFGKKVMEIVRSGTLRKYEELRSMPQIKVISVFSNIFGVGPKTARKWYNLGLRTLGDVESGKCGVVLDRRQKMGLKYFADFTVKIPRSEVQDIEKLVKCEVERVCPGSTVLICGSYRRGKVESGDVDVLVTHPMEQRIDGLLMRIIGRLKDIGFLVDDLSVPSGRTEHAQDSYMGVCRLMDGENRLHRHIDLKVYKPNHFPFAVLYFTGSDHFNRSMRYFAKQKGYTLSDTHLAPAVRVGNTKVHTMTAKAIKCKTERDIFAALGLKYIEPTLRNTYDHFGTSMEEDHDRGMERKVHSEKAVNSNSNDRCDTP